MITSPDAAVPQDVLPAQPEQSPDGTPTGSLDPIAPAPSRPDDAATRTAPDIGDGDATVRLLEQDGRPAVLQPVSMSVEALSANAVMVLVHVPGVPPTDSEIRLSVRAARMSILHARTVDEWEPYAADLAELLRRRPSQKHCQAVSTVVLEDWLTQLDCMRTDDVLTRLRREVRAVHAQLQPLWERRTNAQRSLLLDLPLAGGVHLHDILGDRTASVEERVLPWEPENPRTAPFFSRLDSDEREVARHWAMERKASWQEAARSAGLPESHGERVRRKLRRLGQEGR